MQKLKAILLCLAIFTCPLAHAAAEEPAGGPADRAEQEVARCIRLAAKGKPWLERTLWGLRDQEAGWIGAAVLNDNGTYDLGPLQINSWWVPHMAALLRRSETEIRYWLRYDACFNVDAARWIYLTALHQTRDYWKAVGVYHSPTQWRQRHYALKVAARLEKRFGVKLFPRQRISSRP